MEILLYFILISINIEIECLIYLASVGQKDTIFKVKYTFKAKCHIELLNAFKLFM